MINYGPMEGPEAKAYLAAKGYTQTFDIGRSSLELISTR